MAAEPATPQVPELNLEPKRATMGESIASGLRGMVSGGLGMAIVGGAGAAILAGIAAMIPGGGELTLLGKALSAIPQLSGVGTLASIGAVAAAGAAALGAVGTALGGMAGIIKSREIGRTRIEEIAKLSFAQGVAVGHALEEQAQMIREEQTTKFADKVPQKKAAETSFVKAVGKEGTEEKSAQTRVEEQATAAIESARVLH